ncbi:MAG: sulfite exporter TauE/SafE family protein [Syntrophorhabdales bacterium]|jgi:hypothetical protein
MRRPLTVRGYELLLLGMAALAGGGVNALAGGGTLITFPTLTAVGIPAVAANITNTVALCPGYLSGTFAQSADLAGKGPRLWLLALAAVGGGVAGGVLLLCTGEHIFRKLVPYLILLAAALLAVQEPLRARLSRAGESPTRGDADRDGMAALSVGVGAVYGGYFGAGLEVMLLAILGLVRHESLTRLNAYKQFASFFANTAAAIFFLFSGKVVWSAMVVMAVGALIGGSLGGRMIGRIRPATLRWSVVCAAVIIACIYFLK